jgi:hypothetical protein
MWGLKICNFFFSENENVILIILDLNPNDRIMSFQGRILSAHWLRCYKSNSQLVFREFATHALVGGKRKTMRSHEWQHPHVLHEGH